MSILTDAKNKLVELVKEQNLDGARISVLAKPLTPEEAIGQPGRRDFPIIEGKERIIEAQVLGAKGHAFTDAPGDFIGTVGDVLRLPLIDNRQRAIFIAALNALCRYLGVAQGTVHCKDDDPENCGQEIASHILKNWGEVKVGLIGFNSAIAENLVSTFGKKRVRITDLNKKNIGSEKFGVTIWDGGQRTDELIHWADVLLITGTTLVNNTFDAVWEHLQQDSRKGYFVYGVTAAAISELMGLQRICPYGR